MNRKSLLSPAKPQSSKMLEFAQKLIEPSMPLPKEQRRQSSLLMLFLLALIVFSLVYQIVFMVLIQTLSGTLETVGIMAIMIISYLLCRRGYWKIGAGLAISLIYIAILMVVSGSNDPQQNYGFLKFVVIPLLISGVFFSNVTVWYISILFSLGIIGLTWFIPSVSVIDLIVDTLPFLWLSTGIILISSWHRDTIETERQAELVYSETRFRQMAENIQDVFWTYDPPSQQMIYISPAFEQVVGCTSESFYDNPLSILKAIHPEDRARTWKTIKEVIRGHSIAIETRILHSDGSLHWVWARGFPVFNDRGAVISITGLISDITERKQAETGLQIAERKYHIVADNTETWEFWLGPDQKNFIYVSPSCERITGHTNDEFIKDASLLERVIHPDDLPRYKNHLHEINDAQNLERFEIRVLHRDGTWRWVEHSCKVILDEKGKAMGTRGSHRDVTERKQAEDALLSYNKKLNTILEIENSVAGFLDPKLIYDNLAVGIQKIFPDIPTIFISSFDPEREMIKAAYGSHEGELVDVASLPELPLAPDGTGTQSQVIRSRQPLVIADNLNKKFVMAKPVLIGTSEKVTQSAVYVPMLAQGKALGLIQLQSYEPGRFTENDVRALSLIANTAAVSLENARLFGLSQTELHERKQAEQALRTSEEKYRLIAENVHDIVWSVDADLKFTYASPSTERLLGYTQQDILGTVVMDLLDESSLDQMKKVFQARAEQNTAGGIMAEYRMKHKKGHWVDVEVLSSPIHVQDGNASGYVGIARDVTERKEAEVERQAILEIMQGLAFAKDMNEFLSLVHFSLGRVIKADNFFIALYNPANEMFEEVYTADQYDGPLPPSKHEKTLTSYIFRTRAPFLSTPERFRELVASGEVKLVGTDSPSLLGVPLIASGKTIGVMVVQDYEKEGVYSGRDEQFMMSVAGQVATAVQRRQATDALRESEARFVTIFHHSPVSIAINRLSDNTFVEVNQAWTDTWGYSREEVIGHTALEIGLWADPEERPRLLQMVERKTRVPDFEAVLCKRSGEKRDALLSAELLVIAGESCLLIQVFDITERKQAEKKLHESEAQYRYLFENNPHPMWAYDLKTLQFLAVNDAAVERYGYAREEFLRMTIADIRPPEDLTRLQENLAAPRPVLQHSGEWRHRLKDGTVIDVEISSHTLTLAGQASALVVAQDITARKLAEASFQKSEALLKEAQRLGHIGHWEWTWPNKKLIGSDEVFRIFDIPTGDHTLSLNYLSSFLSPEKLNELSELDSTIFANRIDMDYEFDIHLPDGKVRWLHQYAKITYNEDGLPVHMIGTLQDITDHKQFEEALLKSAQILHEAQDIAYLGSWTADLKTGLFNATAEGARLIGWTTGIHTTDELLAVIHPDDREYMQASWAASLKGAPYNIEHRIILNGEVRWLHVKAKFTFDKDGNPVSALGITQDITERKQSETALKRNEQVLRLFVEHAPAAVAMFDRNMQYIVASQRYLVDYGLGDQNLVGRSHYEVFPDLPERWHEIHQRCLAGAIEKAEEDPYPHPDGSMDWIHWEIRPWFEMEGSVGGVILFSEVITERKQAETLVTAQRDLSRAFSKVTSNQEGWEASLDIALRATEMDAGGLYWFNEDGKTLELVHHQGLGAEFVQAVKSFPVDSPNSQMILLGNTVVFEERELVMDLYKKEGIHSLISVPIIYQEQVLGCLNVASHHRPQVSRNIREMLETIGVEIGNLMIYLHSEAALRVSEENFRLIAQTINEVFWISDPEIDRISYISPAYEQVWGRSLQSLKENPKSFMDAILPEDRAHVRTTLTLQLKGVPFNHEYRIRHPDGSIRTIWDRGFPVHDDLGRVIHYAGVAQDITERKQAELTLRESEDRYRQAITAANAIPYELDYASDRYTFVSESIEKLTGYSSKEFTPADFAKLHISSVMQGDMKGMNVLDAIKLVREGKDGAMWKCDHLIQTRSGQMRWCSDSAIQILDENGVSKGAIGILQDITERMETELALRARTAELTNLLEAGRSLSETLDIKAIYACINQYVKAALPCDYLIISRFDPQNEMITCEYLHSDEGPQNVSSFPPIPLEPPGHGTQSLAIRSGESLLLSDYQQALRTAKNKYIFNEKAEIIEEVPDDPETPRSAIIVPLKVEGKVVGVLQILSDTPNAHTEDHLRFVEALAFHASASLSNARLFAELEERVRQRTAEVSDLYENAPSGYHSLDEAGIVMMVNETELKWLGYSREEMIGHSISEFFTSTSLITFRTNFPVFKECGYLRDLELEYIRKDGSIMPILVNATAIYDKQGKYLTSHSTVLDNTNQKAAEEALRTANLELARAMRMKDEFLASMSHELRTPLTGILGLSEAMQLKTYGELNPKQVKTVKNIQDSGQHLLELINDILDLSKIEAGKLEMQFAPCSLSDICQSSLQLIKGMSSQKRLSVHYAPASVPVVIHADGRRVKQILVNLLSNAIKFTREGSELGLEVRENAAEKNVRITVWDKGIGIKPEDMHKLFRPFTQIDSSLAREYSGTGLGLSLVRNLTELHNGGIEVKSVFGEGSRFTVVLPWSPQNGPSDRLNVSADHADLPGASARVNLPSILIADDNETILELLTDFFEAKQYLVIKARSGLELLEQAAEFHPDIMLVDIQMPGMDGLETIHHIRSHTDPAVAAAPVIAITALAMSGDRERCLEAGANNYMSKPLRLVELTEMIQNLIKKNE
jgi:PAS domain S-box-containing protein